MAKLLLKIINASLSNGCHDNMETSSPEIARISFARCTNGRAQENLKLEKLTDEKQNASYYY